MYGGFAGTETILEERNWQTNTTLLSGDIGVAGDSSDNSYTIIFCNYADSTTTLDGFTIAYGNANDTTPHSTYYKQSQKRSRHLFARFYTRSGCPPAYHQLYIYSQPCSGFWRCDVYAKQLFRWCQSESSTLYFFIQLCSSVTEVPLQKRVGVKITTRILHIVILFKIMRKVGAVFHIKMNTGIKIFLLTIVCFLKTTAVLSGSSGIHCDETCFFLRKHI